MDCCKVFWAIFLPPLAVFLETGCNCDLLINICLTILGWIPGVIHAFCIICRCIEPTDERRLSPSSAPDQVPTPPPVAPAGGNAMAPADAKAELTDKPVV
jgi:uncharacterized membrane protein YqaE (UPF0057 family)